ncbi:hypothetical protein AaE_002928 [Aphanomyces astaci]|uniref:Uncharacterized protein n=1 Tax=Aphanomyces astaci TaxID=112090 RepID=A0A6A5ATE0_APHAT|nr:hypothetical protein AaE_002928 [Aphanomyces astaci]
MAQPKRMTDDCPATPEPKRCVSVLGRMEESPIVTVVALIDSLDEAEAFLLNVPQPTLAVLGGRIVFTERRVIGSSALTVYYVAADDDAPIDDLQILTCKASGDTRHHNVLYLYG